MTLDPSVAYDTLLRRCIEDLRSALLLKDFGRAVTILDEIDATLHNFVKNLPKPPLSDRRFLGAMSIIKEFFDTSSRFKALLFEGRIQEAKEILPQFESQLRTATTSLTLLTGGASMVATSWISPTLTTVPSETSLYLQLSAPVANLLIATLKRLKGITDIDTLAKETGLSPIETSRIINNLAALGYVAQEFDPVAKKFIVRLLKEEG
ncbi:MAG: helix-turn-helix domain-containing protein [Thermoproteota archaeon]